MSIGAHIHDYVEQGSHWIAQYGLLAVGMGIFAECFLLVGLFIPGFAMLITAGLMCAQGDLSIVGTLTAAMIGGFVGDVVAYVLGYQWGDRLLGRHKRSLDRLQRALSHQGGFILLWFHFIGPMRMVVPYLAGSLRFPPARWLLFNTVGLAVWVAFAFTLGYVAMGPLKRFGDLSYYVIFGAIIVMIVYTVWKVVEVLRRKETPAQAIGHEADLAEELEEKIEAIEERIEHSRITAPPR